MSEHAKRTFMVVGTLHAGTDMAEFGALRADEHRQLEVLRAEGRVGAHYVSPARGTTFVEIIAADEEGVAQTMQTLPFARFFDMDVFPTAPADAAELAHRARM
ncbi:MULTISPECIES: hypothetical protein [Actinoplanes]|uniref:hypothetical protein n=1 Tax=Actinoplanes TaxID=1865 RepID=UPI0005F2EE18|nr:MULTISPECIES: hypothetical protein [Actinoplanes]GLY03799.1 hypothetical protein Acsp01_41780 [Actinoplanes sp. NBRC 101535]